MQSTKETSQKFRAKVNSVNKNQTNVLLETLIKAIWILKKKIILFQSYMIEACRVRMLEVVILKRMKSSWKK